MSVAVARKPLTATERKAVSRAAKREGLIFTRCSFPYDVDTIAALVNFGLIDIAAPEDDRLLVQAVADLLDRIAELEPCELQRLQSLF